MKIEFVNETTEFLNSIISSVLPSNQTLSEGQMVVEESNKDFTICTFSTTLLSDLASKSLGRLLKFITIFFTKSGAITIVDENITFPLSSYAKIVGIAFPGSLLSGIVISSNSVLLVFFPHSKVTKSVIVSPSPKSYPMYVFLITSLDISLSSVLCY